MPPAVPPSADSATTTPFLQISGVSKHFGGVRALHEVDLDLRRGEVIALVGDNGAGKSTLVNVVSGVQRPDSGVLHVNGVEVRLDSPRAAAAVGIHTVYQDLSLCDNLDAVKNLFLGLEETDPWWRGRTLRRRAMERRAREVLDSMSVRLRSFTAPVGGMSGGQRQGIAICRALVSDPSLVLLDEPTAALGVSQRAEVLDLILRLKEDNRGVLVISHDLKDVQHVADRVVVLRLGSKVAEFSRGDYTSSDLVAAITGAHEGVA
ncbi:ATP-binding cassette domain-containing protein [Aeromicrobium terrae]|uniref:Sugar ABC transporter ATP-binding protein n=1 Tax=Aeromicrobium terrae TaxID=2498846 RepID=A0A5C8NHK4_9ACTN|nr:ATP-binding cassette domain-containing protein [Aeromicrobium terrae]TXL61354.1 sugar ABC transporter ATP-binding protein [Aeromicrobium terrae]